MPRFNIKKQAIPTVASAYADVIGTTDNQIVEIKNELIIEDNSQHFQIHDDTIEQLAECIAKDGQLNPCIVAPLLNGKYELIDGRHRRRAVIRAGLPTTKCIIKTNLSDKEKQTIRLTANLVRNNDYLPSELAFAYKELAELEDMKTISEETNLSKKKIYRFIRLTFLIEPLLSRVDNGSIPIIAAVELSYLTEPQQRKLFEFLLNHSDCKVTTANAHEIKERPEDLETIFYPKPVNPDLYKELADKALKPYRQNQSMEVDNLSTSQEQQESFHFSGKSESDHIEQEIPVETTSSKMDKLSTYTEDDSSAKPDGTSVAKSARTSDSTNLFYQDTNGNSLSVDSMDKDKLKLLCEYVIGDTHIDFYIFRLAYDSREILHEWNERFIKSGHLSTVTDNQRNNIGVANWNAGKRLFQIDLNGERFLFLHKVLENVVRRYIRENYTLERIKSVIEEECKCK